MVEEEVRFKVEELVNDLVDSIEVVLNVPPLRTTCEAKVALFEGFKRNSAPELIVVVPL